MTTNATKLIAIHKIGRKRPSAKALKTTGYDRDGEPILRVDSETIEPGSVFDEPDPAIVADLRAKGAARYLTEAESAVLAMAAVG